MKVVIQCLSTFSLQTTGEIKVNADLNIRAMDTYNLILTASDKGSPALTAAVKVTINILDINHPPVFGVSLPVNVRENSPSDTLITEVDASDPDTGLNGKITFEISVGNEEGLFKVNQVCPIYNM